MAYYQGGVQPSQLDVSGLAHGIRGRLQQMDAMGLAEVNQYGLPSLAWRAKQGDQAAIRTLRRMGYANWQRLVPTLREDGRGFEAPPGVPWDEGQRFAYEKAVFGFEPETETVSKERPTRPPRVEQEEVPPVDEETSAPPVAVDETPPATAVTTEGQVTPPVTTTPTPPPQQAGPVTIDRGGYAAQQITAGDPETVAAHERMAADAARRAAAVFGDDPVSQRVAARAQEFIPQLAQMMRSRPRAEVMSMLDTWLAEQRQIEGVGYLDGSKPAIWKQAIINQLEPLLRQEGTGILGGGQSALPAQPQPPAAAPAPAAPPQQPSQGAAPWQNENYQPSPPPADVNQRQSMLPPGFLEQVGGRAAVPQADFSPYTLDEAQAYAEQRGETPAAVYEQTIDPKTGAMRPTLQIGDSEPIPIKNAEQDRIAREVTALLDEPEGSPRQQFAQAALTTKIRTQVRPALQEAAKEMKSYQRETGRLVPVSDYARRVAAFIEQDPAAAVQYFMPQATAVLDARGKEATADYQGALAGEARARARIAGIEATAAEQLGDEFARRRALAQVEQMEIGNRILKRQYDFMTDRENAELANIWANVNMTDEQRKFIEPYWELAVAAQELQELMLYAGAQAGVGDNMKFLFEALKSGIFASDKETQAQLMATFMTGATGLNYDPVVLRNLWTFLQKRWGGVPGVKLSDTQATGPVDPNADATSTDYTEQLLQSVEPQ
jgi:hypothetical protein